MTPHRPDPPRSPAELPIDPDLQRRNQALCLMDDIFMRACFQRSPDCVKLILRVLLGKELDVLKVELQKHLTRLNRRSIVMDIFAEDGEGRQYNIEIQSGLSGANARRPRFYLSAMDMNTLEPGDDFERLPDAYSIFIAAGDPFGRGRPLYVFTRRTEDGLPLGDGTTIIYMNVLMQDQDTDLGRLAHDFCCADPDEMWFPELAEATRHFKTDPEGVRNMCGKMAELLREGEEKGRKEVLGKMAALLKEGEEKGEARGESREKCSTVARMLALGKLSLEEIAMYAGLSLDEVRALAEQQRGA